MDSGSLITDLDTYLGLKGAIDADRAQLVLQLAIDRCSMVVTPLPDSARGVVLDVAQRAYANPTGLSIETIGSISQTLPSIGVSLTAANRRELRMMGGRGGAFTVDPTPADAGTGLYPWNQNQTYLNGIPGVDEWSG